jgi:hypothetical protein
VRRLTRRLVVLGILASLLSGCAYLTRPGRKATLLFDEAHGQRFLVGQQGRLDLSSFGAVARNEGLLVGTNREELSDHALAGAEALVVSGPFAPLTPAEVEATLRFLDRGGRLAVMLHIGPPAAALLDALRVDVSNGVIRERENVINDDPLNFRVTRLAPHELTQKLAGFDAFGVWALRSMSNDAAIIARTSERSWMDLNGNQTLDERDAVQSFGVAVAGKRGKGRFVVFGDDAILQNEFLAGDNLTLARNLARWFVRAR